MPGQNYLYRVRAVTDTFTGWPMESESILFPPSPGWGIVDFNFQDGEHNSPHLLDIPDSAEESVGYFIPVNNNFDEGNVDAMGSPVPDNQPDATSGHSATFSRNKYFTDRQLNGLSVSLYGDLADQITFEFPSAIKLWTDLPDPVFELVEIASGVSYSINDLLFSLNGFVFIEGIEESESPRDAGPAATKWLFL